MYDLDRMTFPSRLGSLLLVLIVATVAKRDVSWYRDQIQHGIVLQSGSVEETSMWGKVGGGDLRSIFTSTGPELEKVEKHVSELTWPSVVAMTAFVLLLPLIFKKDLFNTESEKFNMSVGGMILLNTILICLETDLPHNIVFEVADHLFNLLFLVELLLRVKQVGCAYFKSGWNLFDCVLVTFGVLELWILPLVNHFHASGDLINLDWVRVLKVCRCLRLIRVFRMFKQLTMIAQAFLDALATVCWTGALIFLMDLILAIFATQLVGHEADGWDDPKDASLLKERFGTITKSMYTLFMIMTLDSWSEICSAIMKRYFFVVFLFMLYIIVASYTMVSLITGIISDSLISRRNEDAEDTLKTFQHQFLAALPTCYQDDSTTISKAEISAAMENPELVKQLVDLDFDCHNAQDLNELFDVLSKTLGNLNDQGEHSIAIRDFFGALVSMHGQATAKSTFLLHQEVVTIGSRVDQIKDDTAESIRQLAASVQDLSAIVKDLSAKVDRKL